MAKSKSGVSDNIYTTLVFVSLVALAIAVGYVVVRSNTLFGSWNPADAAKLGPAMLTGLFG